MAIVINAILKASWMFPRVRPKWDGKPETWDEFWKEWDYFWKLREEAFDANPEYKKLLFIDSLPDSETKRATRLVVNNRISV
jgi:hypothetical protein